MPRRCTKSRHYRGKKCSAGFGLPKQCADNDNFQNIGDVVPCSLILPSENFRFVLMIAEFFARLASIRFSASEPPDERRLSGMNTTVSLHNGRQIHVHEPGLSCRSVAADMSGDRKISTAKVHINAPSRCNGSPRGQPPRYAGPCGMTAINMQACGSMQAGA